VLLLRSTLTLWRCAAKVIAPFWFLLFYLCDVGRVAVTNSFKLTVFFYIYQTQKTPLTTSSGHSQWRILLLGLCFLYRGTTASRHSSHSGTGWRCRSASSLSWLLRHHRVLSDAPVIRFNHRGSSFSGRCCPTVEHSAIWRLVGIVNICFQKRLRTHFFILCPNLL